MPHASFACDRLLRSGVKKIDVTDDSRRAEYVTSVSAAESLELTARYDGSSSTEDNSTFVRPSCFGRLAVISVKPFATATGGFACCHAAALSTYRSQTKGTIRTANARRRKTGIDNHETSCPNR